MTEFAQGSARARQVHSGIAPEGFAALEQQVFRKPWRSGDFGMERPYRGWFLGDASLPEAFLFMQVLEDEAELLRIATHPDCRRQGLARHLWNGFLTDLDMNQVQCVFLEVSSHNTAAQNLYRTLGFFETGRRRGYYGPEEDAVLMTWERKAPN